VAEGAGSGTPTIARARTPPAAVRLVSAGVEDALERFSDPTLLSTGKINIISLEAVEARFAARWELRRE